MIDNIKRFIKSRQKLTFIMADEFFAMLAVYRALWIKGRFGGGKTSLAVILGAWLLNSETVSQVVSNFPTVLSTHVEGADLLYDAAIIIDETHAFIGGRKDVDKYAAYLRKTNYYLLMPSVMPPHIKLCFFSVQRVFNGYRYGLPIWVYKWFLRVGATKEQGNFAILNPAFAFGTYPTRFVPFDDGGIGGAIGRTMDFEAYISDKYRSLIVSGLDTPEWKQERKLEYSKSILAGTPLTTAPKKTIARTKKDAKPVPTNESGMDEIQDALDDTAEALNETSEDVTQTLRKIRSKLR